MHRRTFVLSAAVVGIAGLPTAALAIWDINRDFNIMSEEYQGITRWKPSVLRDYLDLIVNYAQSIIDWADTAGPVGLAVAYHNLSNLESWLGQLLRNVRDPNQRVHVTVALARVKAALSVVASVAAKQGLTETDLVNIYKKLPRREQNPIVLPRAPREIG